MSKGKHFGERGRRLKRAIGMECEQSAALLLQSNSKFEFNFVVYVRNPCRACDKIMRINSVFGFWLKVASVTKKGIQHIGLLFRHLFF